MVRRLQIALAVVVGLLIAPFAINVGTGGEAPGWLQPYADWLWPFAIACVGLVVVLEIRSDVHRERTGKISARRPHAPGNVKTALERVAWYVEGRRRGSLAERVRLELTLDELPSAVQHPAYLVQRISGEEFQLSGDLGIAEVFEELSESMLILGAPGAGKTTQLLDLAAALVFRATASGGAQQSQAELAPTADESVIPVVVDLADWSAFRRRQSDHGDDDDVRASRRGRRDFVSWLLASLWTRYGIPEQVGRVWLRENRFALLLDGLDEVDEADRERCVDEINQLQIDWDVTRLAVCSREADYNRLTARLRLQGAVVIRPLTRDQVGTFLTEVSPRLAGIAATLGDDQELWELLTTPLMLNIMVLAEGGRTWQALSEESDLHTRRRHLFDAYVVEVLARRSALEAGDAERALRALRRLAEASAHLGAGVEVVRLNHDTVGLAVGRPISNVIHLWMYRVSLTIWITVVAAAMGMYFSAAAALIVVFVSWLVWALIWMVDLMLVEGIPVIRPAPIANYFALVGYLIAVILSAGALVFGLTWLIEVLGQSSATVLGGWAVGFSGAIGATVCIKMAIGQPDWDGDHDHLSVRVQFLLFALALVVPPVVAESQFSPFWLPVVGCAIGVASGLIPGMITGWSQILIGPFARVAMVIAGEPVPWRSTFLQFAADRSLLTFSNGEYRFIHILVRDHLFGCDPAQLARAVQRRRAELALVAPDA